MAKIKKRGKALSILAGRSGASILFVLAVTLLLMAIGVSTLTAASANMASDTKNRFDNQLNLFADSMHRTIMQSLVQNGGDVNKYAYISPGSGLTATTTTLGGQILGAVYAEALDQILNHSANPGYPVPVELIIAFDTPTADGDNLSDITGVNVTGVEIDIDAAVLITRLTPHEDAVTSSEDGVTIVISPEILRQPQAASINGTATVTVTAGHGGNSVISAVTYHFTDGFLEDDGNAANDDDPDDLTKRNMVIRNAGAGAGDWGFVSREKADHVA